MDDFVQRVLTWNKAAGRTDSEFNVRAVALHFGLQLEEMAEKLASLGLKSYAIQLDDMAIAFKQGDLDASVKYADRTALLDADCDIMVVTVGAMMASGVDVHGALDEVCASNRSKSVYCTNEHCQLNESMEFFIDTDTSEMCPVCQGRGWILTKDKNGKIQKGKDYTAPNLEQFTNKD